MKKFLVVLAALLATALGAVRDSDAGRQRFKVKQVQEEPKGAHRTVNKSRRNVHEDANRRRLREQQAKSERQEAAAKAKTRKQQTAKQIAAGNKKKQRGQ
jgi:hypothetical protein